MLTELFHKINKKFLFVGLFSIVLVIIIYTFINYIDSIQQVTINYKHVSNVVIFEDFVANNSPENNKSVTVIKKSGETITLPKKNYFINYTPEKGYEDKNISLALFDNKKNISIDPDFSAEKLELARKKEFSFIKQSLAQKYPDIENLYSIQTGKLYKKGQWYATTLQYIGEDYVNADSLRLVMKKKGGKWELITTPPSITLSKYNYPSIPLDILDDINNEQYTPILDQYNID